MISIVTAAYNCDKYIQDTYQSIATQTHENWEWLVVDDFSTDKTLDLLSDIALQDKRVRVLRNERNRGAAASRNLAIDHSRGEFVAFIDSDDVWEANKLSTQLEFMKNGIDFSFTAYRIIDETGAPTGRIIDGRKALRVSYPEVLEKKVTLGCSTVMLRRSTIREKRMPEIRAGQDYAFWLRILREGGEAHLLPKVLGSYRIRRGSLSRNKAYKAKQQWHIYRNIERLSIIRSSKCFSLYAFRAIFR